MVRADFPRLSPRASSADAGSDLGQLDAHASDLSFPRAVFSDLKSTSTDIKLFDRFSLDRDYQHMLALKASAGWRTCGPAERNRTPAPTIEW